MAIIAQHQCSFSVQEVLVRQVVENLFIDANQNYARVAIKAGSTIGSDDGNAILVADSDIIVDITTSGVNGLDTGAEAPNTWYYVYMILNPISGLVRGLLSASPTSPILPSGYVEKRMVSAVRNDGSSNFYQYFQKGNKVVYLTLQGFSAAFTSNNVWVAVDFSDAAPVVSRELVLAVRSVCLAYNDPISLNIVWYAPFNLSGGRGANGVILISGRIDAILTAPSTPIYAQGSSVYTQVDILCTANQVASFCGDSVTDPTVQINANGFYMPF
jgi:hypothetical protein